MSFNLVSRCCEVPIVGGTKIEYPLDYLHGISLKVDICDECGRAVENPLEQCGVCGETECDGACE